MCFIYTVAVGEKRQKDTWSRFGENYDDWFLESEYSEITHLN